MRNFLKNFKFFEKKKYGLRKKSFSFNTDTKIGPWFRFPIPKPKVSLTLPHAMFNDHLAYRKIFGEINRKEICTS